MVLKSKTKKGECKMRSLTKENPHMRWIYYRRRAVLLFAFISIGIVGYRAKQPGYTCDSVVSVRALPGDSLWNIVSAHCRGNINQATDDAFTLNGSKFIITIGQDVFLPGKKGK